MPFAPPRAVVSALLALGWAALAAGQGSPPKASPFLTIAGPAGAAAAPAAFQLTGIDQTGDVARLCILEARSGRNRWISLGTTADDIRAVRYDADREEAVIAVQGVEMTLGLRAATAGEADNSSPAPVTGAAAGPAPALRTIPPETPAQRDRRFLVSDLLDIGQQQRQALEQKAAAAPAAAPRP